jgi:hypothetical protein
MGADMKDKITKELLDTLGHLCYIGDSDDDHLTKIEEIKEEILRRTRRAHTDSAKSITVHHNGDITMKGALTDEEKLRVGDLLFDQQEADNDGQILFYTGIKEVP